MPRPSQIRRLFSFSLKPILSVIFVFFLLRLTGLYSPSPSSKSTKKYSHLSKSLIIASQKGSNLTWLPPAASAGHWDLNTYITDGQPTELAPNTVPLNKGHEAMVYLTYIIDNYHNLPDIMFFHHHHQQAWHQMFSSSYEFAHLDPLSVQKQGYLSPRCLPGCENIIELSGDVSPLEDLKGTSRDVQISSVLHEFLDPGEKVPTKIAAPCCAQFAVSKEAVERRTLETWEGLRKWLMETELDSRSSGRVLEYTWHLWFGKEAVL